jgi:hypothetical protein
LPNRFYICRLKYRYLFLCLLFHQPFLLAGAFFLNFWAANKHIIYIAIIPLRILNLIFKKTLKFLILNFKRTKMKKFLIVFTIFCLMSCSTINNKLNDKLFDHENYCPLDGTN